MGHHHGSDRGFAIAGSLTDRYGPATGRRRFWLLVSLPLMLIGVHQIFLPPDDVSWVHFAIWMMVLYVGWTLLTISHISWGVELSDDYQERARIAAYRQAAALIGGIVVVFIPVLSDQLGTGTEASRVGSMGIFVMAGLPVLVIIAALLTPVAPARRTQRDQHDWRDVFTILKHNRSLRALLVGNMGILLGLASTSSALLFYVQHVLRLGEWSSLAIIPLLLSGLLYLPLLKALIRKWGKHRTFQRVLIFQICVQPLLFLIPPENLTLAVMGFAVLGAANGAATFLPLAMIADLKDVRTGSVTDRTGIYVALLQSSSKVAAALSVALMFVALQLTGFDPGDDVGTSDTMGLRSVIVFLPVVCYAFGLAGSRGYELERRTQEPLNFGASRGAEVES